jgi:Prolipoprotein diacylglyceryl transferase
VHAYGLAYVAALVAAVAITTRRWERGGGDRDLVYEVALWGVPTGLIGGRLYFLATSWGQVPPHWWGPVAVWDGGLGIWGGIACGTLAGLWVLRRRGADIPRFLDAAAPALLVAQAIGRVGNYFNQELFGGPTGLPWALQISPAHRPVGYEQFATFHPTFLYEIVWNLALAAGPRLAGSQPSSSGPGTVRALYRRLLPGEDRRRAAASRPGSSHSRAAAEPLRRRPSLRRRVVLVRPNPGRQGTRLSVAQADGVGNRRSGGGSVGMWRREFGKGCPGDFP